MIFGIGLAKTGTHSLNDALELLGWRSIHYPDPALMLGGRFDEALDGCDAATDAPVAALYRQLDAAIPGSRFILTQRDLEPWLASLEHHMSLQDPASFMGDSPKGLLRERLYGTRRFVRQTMIQARTGHRHDALQYFRDRPGDLLVMDICAGQGWETLCPFVGVPAPDRPFPHAARRWQPTPAASGSGGIGL